MLIPFSSRASSVSSVWIRRSVIPEAVAGEVDEDVFERRLAERDGFDAVGEGFDQLGDPLVAVRLLEPHGAVDDLRLAR